MQLFDLRPNIEATKELGQTKFGILLTIADFRQSGPKNRNSKFRDFGRIQRIGGRDGGRANPAVSRCLLWEQLLDAPNLK